MTEHYLVQYNGEQRVFGRYDDAYDHAKAIRDEHNVQTKVFRVTMINRFDKKDQD